MSGGTRLARVLLRLRLVLVPRQTRLVHVPRRTRLAPVALGAPLAAGGPRRLVVALAALALTVVPAIAQSPGEVVATVHNLSASGPGTIKAVDETRICVFCHIPHTASGREKLWSKELPTGPWLQPDRDEEGVRFASPTEVHGPSRMCLSCHDGTLALGVVFGRATAVEMQNTDQGRMPSDAEGFLGQDLTGSHPIGLRLTQALLDEKAAEGLSFVPLTTLQADSNIHLTNGDELHCTTCHDPHSDARFGSSGVHFYRSPDYSGTCTACHAME